MNLKLYTYKQYLDLIKSMDQINVMKELGDLKNRFRDTSPMLINISPVLFIVDYASREYLYMDAFCEQVIGLPASYYYEQGIKGFWEQAHPEDFSLINEHVFPINLNFISKIEKGRYSDFIFSHNFRVRNTENKYIQVLQRSSFIESTVAEVPAGVIGVIYDITHFKNDTLIIHTIEEAQNSNTQITYKLHYKTAYPANGNKHEIFTIRELQVLDFIRKGYSSKQIANLLSISVNTVNNHRKKMLQKSGAPNFAALLKLALKRNWV